MLTVPQVRKKIKFRDYQGEANLSAQQKTNGYKNVSITVILKCNLKKKKLSSVCGINRY